MALTRPRLGQLVSSVAQTSDPITVLKSGTSANVDVGFLMNRANGLVSNVAIYWNESGNTFALSFTNSSGTTDANIVPTSYANLTVGTLTANTLSVAGGGINGVTIGAVTPAAGTFTSLTADTLNVAGGGLNSVAIGQTTPAAGTFTTANAVTLSGNLSPATGLTTIYSTGHVVPTANVTYDLGTPTQRFRSLYLSGSTIYLGNAVITTTTAGDIVFNTSGSFAVPVGSTTQRSEIQGAMRYNTTLSKFESFDGTTWNTLAYGGASDFPTDDFGDLQAVLVDPFGAKMSNTFDCNQDGPLTYADLSLVGDATASPI